MKSLGQIAYETYANQTGRLVSSFPWAELHPEVKLTWEAVGSAIGNECATIAEQNYASANAIRARMQDNESR